MSFDPSPARRGIDALLARYPHLDVLSVVHPSSDVFDLIGKPWIGVTLGQPSDGQIEAYARWEFAIWKNTGAVYVMNEHGAVSDDPIIEAP